MQPIISATHLVHRNEVMIASRVGNTYRVVFVGPNGEFNAVYHECALRSELDAFVAKQIANDSGRL